VIQTGKIPVLNDAIEKMNYGYQHPPRIKHIRASNGACGETWKDDGGPKSRAWTNVDGENDVQLNDPFSFGSNLIEISIGKLENVRCRWDGEKLAADAHQEQQSQNRSHRCEILWICFYFALEARHTSCMEPRIPTTSANVGGPLVRGEWNVAFVA
jgi:hypothetical protein